MNNKKREIKVSYNKKDLNINSDNTLIIIDWDDTLYPTTWSINNGIDLTDPKSRYRHMRQFEQLDQHISSTLKHISSLGEIIIITNAMPEWIELSASVLPKTKKCLDAIDVVSARLKCQNHSKMSEWKKYTFIEEIFKRSKKQKYTNIMSLGDAEFEHNALINLYDLKFIPHKYLKSVKFTKSPNYDVLIEQIKMIRKYISQICKMTRQIDMTFDTQ
jgi:hypothetical protein